MVHERFTPYGYVPCVIAVVAINHTALCANNVGSLREFIYVFLDCVFILEIILNCHINIVGHI